MQDKKIIVDNNLESLKMHFKVDSDGELAEKLDTSYRAIAQWRWKNKIPKWVLRKYDQIISGVGEKVVVAEQPIHIQKGKKQVDIRHSKDSTLLDATYIIDLQKDKIEHQAIEIKSLKDALQKKQAESTHWESLEFDYIAETTLIRERFKFGRTIDKVTDLKKQSQVLGYTEDELLKMWDIGVKHLDMKNHPIDKLINAETQKEIQRQSLTLPIVFDAMKAIVGDHYIPQPMIYIHKQGHNVGAIAYCKVEWTSMRVTAKVKFLVN